MSDVIYTLDDGGWLRIDDGTNLTESREVGCKKVSYSTWMRSNLLTICLDLLNRDDAINLHRGQSITFTFHIKPSSEYTLRGVVSECTTRTRNGRSKQSIHLTHMQKQRGENHEWCDLHAQ